MEEPAEERLWMRLARSRGMQVGFLLFAVAALIALRLGEDVTRVVEDLGPLGTALLVVTQGLLAATPIPSQPIGVGLAAIHGFLPGLALVWTGWMLTAVLQYALARRTADDIDLPSLLARTPDWVQRFPADRPLFLIVARQLPLGPHIVNVAAGALRVPLALHLACSAIAILPQATIVTAIGVQLFGVE